MNQFDDDRHGLPAPAAMIARMILTLRNALGELSFSGHLDQFGFHTVGSLMDLFDPA
jgi:hypothetical protein